MALRMDEVARLFALAELEPCPTLSVERRLCPACCLALWRWLAKHNAIETVDLVDNGSLARCTLWRWHDSNEVRAQANEPERAVLGAALSALRRGWFGEVGDA
jgi:hypothetical protein